MHPELTDLIGCSQKVWDGETTQHTGNFDFEPGLFGLKELLGLLKLAGGNSQLTGEQKDLEIEEFE